EQIARRSADLPVFSIESPPVFDASSFAEAARKQRGKIEAVHASLQTASAVRIGVGDHRDLTPPDRRQHPAETWRAGAVNPPSDLSHGQSSGGSPPSLAARALYVGQTPIEPYRADSSLIERDRRAVWHPYTSLREPDPPLVVTEALDEFLYLEDGRRVIDA